MRALLRIRYHPPNFVIPVGDGACATGSIPFEDAFVAKILLVEDDPDQREVYEALLYYNGFDVIVAEDGEAGLRAAVENPPDAILIDVMLPGLNGLAASSLIHTNPATAHVPIICMSAYDVRNEQVLRAGANEFLPKPVSGDVLVRSIRRYIGWDDARKEVPSHN